MAKKLRLFWAANLPGEIKDKLQLVQERLMIAGADAKWVEHRNLHITLKFLGETDAGMVAPMAGLAAGGLKGCRAFGLELGDLGFFPGQGPPRVLWVGLKGEVGLLKEAARAVDDLMAVQGFPREVRRFLPHLTLARIRSPRNVEELIRTMGEENNRAGMAGSFRVSTIDLMQSDLSPRGPEYTLLASIRLTG